MNGKKYDVIVVGSGAGGAQLARELARRGKQLLVIERGRLETRLGTFNDATRYYDATRLTHIPKKSKEGVTVWRALMAGGSTVVSAGNGVPSLAGSHPGGTAAIGKVVDRNLQTAVDGLFVCDASVLPAAPGLPPIMTILALSRRLARALP